METTSQTPRTDEECGGPPKSGDDTWPSMYVTADFARQLETELNEARAGNAELLERLRERTESHLAASARDAHDNQRLRVENEAMRDAMRQLYDMTEGYADGAPDATAHDKLCNEISAKLQPFIKP